MQLHGLKRMAFDLRPIVGGGDPGVPTDNRWDYLYYRGKYLDLLPLMVTVTFDDAHGKFSLYVYGPDPKYDPQVFETLKRQLRKDFESRFNRD